jgi:hypothetical protein
LGSDAIRQGTHISIRTAVAFILAFEVVDEIVDYRALRRSERIKPFSLLFPDVMKGIAVLPDPPLSQWLFVLLRSASRTRIEAVLVLPNVHR